MSTIGWWVRTLIVAHLAKSAEVGGSFAPTILSSGVDIRPLRTWIRSLDARPLSAHVSRLASKFVLAIADLVRDLREGGTERSRSDIETVVGKEVAVLAIETHLVDWTAETLRSFVGNLQVLAIVRRGIAQIS